MLVGGVFVAVVLGCGSGSTGGGSSGSSGGTSSGSSGSSGGPSGGSSGASSGGTSGSPGGPTACTETKSPAPLDQATSLGYSPSDVLKKVASPQTIDVKWISPTPGDATSSLAGTQTTLTVTLDSANASATFIDSKGGGCPSSGTEIACIVCTSRLEIAVPTRLVTADGALDESATVTLGGDLHFALDIDAANAKGNYLSKVTPKAGLSLIGVHVEAAYGGSFSGSHKVVPGEWNGFAAATVKGSNAGALDEYTSHGYFPPAAGP